MSPRRAVLASASRSLRDDSFSWHLHAYLTRYLKQHSFKALAGIKEMLLVQPHDLKYLERRERSFPNAFSSLLSFFFFSFFKANVSVSCKWRWFERHTVGCLGQPRPFSSMLCRSSKGQFRIPPKQNTWPHTAACACACACQDHVNAPVFSHMELSGPADISRTHVSSCNILSGLRLSPWFSSLLINENSNKQWRLR